MGYVIQAIIAGSEALVRTSLGKGRTFPLSPQLAMLPLTKELREALALPFCPLTDEGAEPVLPPALLEVVQAASVGGKAAYIEAEFFGGVGLQACLLSEGGIESQRPHVGPMAINMALQFLGVQRGSAVDEFEAVGLGKYRSTEEWNQNGA
jgi:hypothetical protein